MQTDTATIGNSMEASQKFSYDLVILFGVYPKELKSESLRDILCTPMFVAILFTNSQTMETTKYLSIGSWIKKKCDMHTHTYLHTHNSEILFSHEKERILAACNT